MKKLPDGPKTPKFLQRLQLILDPVGYLETNARKYGDVFKSLAKGYEAYVVSNPQALQKILTRDTEEFNAPGKWNDFLRPLLGDNSVSVLSGEAHQRQRQLLMPTFHGEHVNAYGQIICNLTKQVMDRLSADRLFVGRTAMQEISLQVILRVIFGIYEGERYQHLKLQMSTIMDLFDSPALAIFLFVRSLQRDFGPLTTWGQYLRLQHEIDSLLFAEISERRALDNCNRTDVLSLLINARDEAGEAMTDQELRDELFTMLVAGHEPPTTAMTWALYWTHYFPQIGEKLRFELDTLGEKPNPTEIAKLPYLNAVCNETLRIHSVAMGTSPREAREPVELLGCEFPAGSVFRPSIYLLHQREDLYPEPKKFKPERFLERTFSPYEFMPFGGGVRRCIGSALALYEMKLVVATILSNYQLELLEKRPVKPQRRNVTLAPKGGVKMVMRGKRQN